MRGLVCEEASTSILSVTEMHLPVTKNDASVTEKDMPLPRDEHDRASSTLLRRQERMLERLTEIGKLEDRVLVDDALPRGTRDPVRDRSASRPRTAPGMLGSLTV
jgi:hypothetical protein